MTDQVSEAYGDALKAKNELSSLHEDFERGRNRSIAVQQRLAMMGKEFRAKVEKFATLGRGDVKWDRRVRALEDDLSLMEQLLNNQLGQLFQRRHEDEKRAELLGNRTATDNDVANLAKERRGINDSILSVNSLIDSGTAMISGIGHNNNLVKGAHTKVLNVANALGVSDALLNVISGRDAQDRALVCGCSLFSLFIFCVLWYMVKM